MEGRYRCSLCPAHFEVHDGIIDLLNREDKQAEELERYYQGVFAKEDPYNLRTGPMLHFPIGHDAKMGIVWNMLSEYEDKKGLTLLDVGCGENPEAFKNLEVYNNTVIYHDISKLALSRVRKRACNNRSLERLFLAANEHVPVQDETIDIVFAGEILEHVKQPRKFLDGCADALKRNGILILTTPNSNALTYRLFCRTYAVHEQHVSLQSYTSAVTLLGKRFEVLDVKGINQGIIGFRPDRIFNVSKRFCAFWANIFADRPQWATGLIFKCRKA